MNPEKLVVSFRAVVREEKMEAQHHQTFSNNIRSVKLNDCLSQSCFKSITDLSTHNYSDKLLNIHFIYEEQLHMCLRSVWENALFVDFCIKDLVSKTSSKPSHTSIPNRGGPKPQPGPFLCISVETHIHWFKYLAAVNMVTLPSGHIPPLTF